MGNRTGRALFNDVIEFINNTVIYRFAEIFTDANAAAATVDNGYTFNPEEPIDL